MTGVEFERFLLCIKMFLSKLFAPISLDQSRM